MDFLNTLKCHYREERFTEESGYTKKVRSKPCPGNMILQYKKNDEYRTMVFKCDICGRIVEYT
jgi:hypothetical protein